MHNNIPSLYCVSNIDRVWTVGVRGGRALNDFLGVGVIDYVHVSKTGGYIKALFGASS